MTGLVLHRRRPKHARTAPPAREVPAETPVPRRYWPVMLWRDHERRGVPSDPAHEDAMRSLGREYDAWQQERGT